MSLGVYNNSGLGVSEFACPVANNQTVAASVPTDYCKEQGQMDFLKTTAGGTVYIGLCGKKVSPTNYDIILTDTVPFYNLAGLALGDISVTSSVAGMKVSITILACT